MLSTLLRSARGSVSRNVLSRCLATEANEMQFTFASPGGVYYNAVTNVKQVDVPSFSGSIGILPNHVPVLAVLKPGVVVVHEESGDMRKYFVSSGSVTVNEDKSVQILAEEAFPLEDLDATAAKQALASAQSELNSASDEKSQAEAQIKFDVSQAIVSAAEQGA